MSAEIFALKPSPQASTDEEILALYAVADRAVPWLRANFVASADGAATHDGLSAGLGSPADRRVFDLLRRLADVIVVGAGTVRKEGYDGMRLDDASVAWRKRNGLPPHPVFAIVSARLDLDPTSRVFADTPVRPLVITGEAAPQAKREPLARVADVLLCGRAGVDTRLMRSALAERGLPQMHSEGGPHLLGTLIEEATVDELCLTVAPRVEGGTARRIADGHLPAATRLTLAHTLSAADGTLLLRYTRG